MLFIVLAYKLKSFGLNWHGLRFYTDDIHTEIDTVDTVEDRQTNRSDSKGKRKAEIEKNQEEGLLADFGAEVLLGVVVVGIGGGGAPTASLQLDALQLPMFLCLHESQNFAALKDEKRGGRKIRHQEFWGNLTPEKWNPDIHHLVSGWIQ